jgi:hypothetical protein
MGDARLVLGARHFDAAAHARGAGESLTALYPFRIRRVSDGKPARYFTNIQELLGYLLAKGGFELEAPPAASTPAAAQPGDGPPVGIDTPEESEGPCPAPDEGA